MTRNRVTLIICMLFAALLTSIATARAELVAYDPNTMSYPISTTQAIASARAWAQNPSLSLVLQGVSIGSWDSMDANYYVFKTSDNLQTFEVDCNSGERHHWQDITATAALLTKLDALWPDSTKLPVATLNNMIAQCLSQKYANFAALNLQQVDPTIPTNAYFQHFTNGTWYPGNNALCLIDPWSGTITDYFGTHCPVPTVSTVPTVTSTQAELLALNFAGTIYVADEDGTDPSLMVHPQSAFVLGNSRVSVCTDALGVQRLQWAVPVVVSPSSGYTAALYASESTDPFGPSGQVFSVYVDALTGEAFGYEDGGYLGNDPRKLDSRTARLIRSIRPNPAALKAQPPYPKCELRVGGADVHNPAYAPVIINSTCYLYVRYLTAIQAGHLDWTRSGVSLKMGKVAASLQPGSCTIEVDGQPVAVQHPVVMVAGRAFVPYELIPHLIDARASWDAKSRVLRIDSAALADRFKATARPSVISTTAGKL